MPAPPLNAYIHDLYYVDGQSPYPRLKVAPDAMLHLMVNLGQHLEVYAPNHATPFATCSESWWIGLREVRKGKLPAVSPKDRRAVPEAA